MVCLADLYNLRSILNLSSCSLSFVLSILVIFFIIKKKLFRADSFKILIYISINDLLRSSIGIIEFLTIPNQTMCSVSGFLDFYFFASNAVWALCLTFTIFQIIVLEETNFAKYHKIWVFISIFIVGGVEALPFITQSYGSSNKICQMKGDETGKFWRFYIFYIPLSIVFILIFVLFFKIMRKVKDVGIDSVKTIIVDRGLIYTFIILLAFTPLLIARIVEMFEQGCFINSFTVCVIIFYNLQGFFNGVVFFYNKTIRAVIFQERNTFNSTIQTEISSLRISMVSELTN